MEKWKTKRNVFLTNSINRKFIIRSLHDQNWAWAHSKIALTWNI